MQARFEVVPAHMDTRETGEYDTFGVRCPDGRVFQDISLNLPRMQAFVERLERGMCSMLHIEDVIDDFLAEE